MLRSISVGIGVALALPLGWLLFWWLGVVTLRFPSAEDKAIGLGFVAGKMAELLIVGSILGLITALLLLDSFQKSVSVAISEITLKMPRQGF